MTLILFFGLLLWVLVHIWKSVAPDHRASFGDKGKIIIIVGSVIAIFLMVIGYRGAEGMVFWNRNAGMTALNNVLMVFAFYLFAASGAKTRITMYFRHPQFASVIVWAVAHLLVNGDTSSLLLFGGMALWAAMEIVLINSIQVPRMPYQAVPVKKEITAVIATIVVVAVAAGIHTALGYNPFG